MILSLLTTCKDAEEKKSKLQAVFDTWIESPLECLIELGISKLSKDLLYHFISSNLAQFAQFASFFETSLSVSEKIQNLFALLSVLELSLLVSSHVISLPHDAHRNLIENALILQRQSYEPELLFKVPLSKFSTLVSRLVHAVTNR